MRWPSAWKNSPAPLSTFALQELTESAKRADNAELFGALPSHNIDRASILDALHATRDEG